MTSKIVFDRAIMELMQLFARIARVDLKDCVVDDTQVIFIVGPGDVGKAVGAKGANIRKMEAACKKRVKVAEFNDDCCQFVANLCAPAKVKDCKLEGKVVTVVPGDLQSRGLIIGKNASTLRKYESIVKRYFPIDEIKVTSN